MSRSRVKVTCQEVSGSCEALRRSKITIFIRFMAANSAALTSPRAGSAPPVLNPSAHKSRQSAVSPNVNCTCGLLNSGCKQTIPCTQCKNLSHLQCVHLTVRTAKKTTFVCRDCKAKLPKVSPISRSASQPTSTSARSIPKLTSRTKAPIIHKNVTKPSAPSKGSNSSNTTTPVPCPAPLESLGSVQMPTASTQPPTSVPSNHHCSIQSGLESDRTKGIVVHSDKNSVSDNHLISPPPGCSSDTNTGLVNLRSYSSTDLYPSSADAVSNPDFVTLDCVLKLVNKVESSLRAELNLRLLSLENHVNRLNKEIEVLKRSCPRPALSTHPVYHQFPSRPTPYPPRRVAPHPSRHPVPHSPRHTVPPSSPNLLPYRVIWGTPRNCSSAVIFKAISALLEHSVSDSIMIRRTSRQRSHKSIWWFTIMAPPNTIRKIEDVWTTIQSKTSWSLRTSLSSHQNNINHHPVSAHSHSSHYPSLSS